MEQRHMELLEGKENIVKSAVGRSRNPVAEEESMSHNLTRKKDLYYIIWQISVGFNKNMRCTTIKTIQILVYSVF